MEQCSPRSWVVETSIMGSSMLVLAGSLSLAVAALHAVMAFSPAMCRSFGAPESFVARGPVVVLVVTLLLAMVFASWGLYALSGAGWLPRLPLLLPALVGIGAIFTMRGLLVLVQLLVLAGVLRSRVPVGRRDVVFSTVSLLIGIAYLVGTFASWQLPAS
jgi:hypothetical protein